MDILIWIKINDLNSLNKRITTELEEAPLTTHKPRFNSETYSTF